ncbi:MAG: flagellar FliJ family protein [Synergistaceae bacterium]|jgi:flagellar export protein FliJ|nr:flagellar FliJ family protein [Synergistaceae bacterium]
MNREVGRFKRVLRVRSVEREATQGELAAHLQEEGAILDRINTLEARRDSAVESFCGGTDGAVPPQQLWFERQNIELMERSLDSDRQELDACRFKIEGAKAELLRRHQNVQIMERYVGRLEERADREVLSREQKDLDDITSMRYGRGAQGGGRV